MREPHMPGPLPPRDWNDAFAALPPETPPTDALSRVFARVPVSARRRSWRLPLALAASLVALACVSLLLRESPRESRTHTGATRAVATATVPAPKPVANTTTETPVAAVAADATPLPKATRPHPVRIANVDRPRRNKPHRTHGSTPAGDAIDQKAMESLYAESARLEALLAVARDDRVGTATAVALGSDFETRLASIDAALIQSSPNPQRRLELWRDRVSALRAYASFESTQRALAARGERYDAMLVSVD